MPEYTRKTARLSPQAIAVRNALLSAQEPGPLVFHELPKACGLPPFLANKKVDSAEAESFIIALRSAIDELRFAYARLQERIAQRLAEGFGETGTLNSIRYTLAERAENSLIAVTDNLLRAFCLRLRDTNLPESEWIDSLGSLICSMPPLRWRDTDEAKYSVEVEQLIARLCSVEKIAFGAGRQTKDSSALRIAITRADGTEIGDVVRITADEEGEVAALADQLVKIMLERRNVGLAAAARAFWSALESDKKL